MKTMRAMGILIFAAALLVGNGTARAQDTGAVTIRRFLYRATRTPEYTVRTKGSLQERTRDWGEIVVLYETAPDFLDELEFTFYVIMRGKDPRAPFALLKGSIAYVHIEKGRHQSTMYLHPSVLARFGAIEGMAVEIRAAGRLVAVETDGPRGREYQRAIQELAPRENHVLPPSQTPFAMIGFDNNEMVKP